MADDNVWTFTLDDGDHVVKTEAQGRMLRILVDGFETSRTKVKRRMTQPFRVGGHVARVEAHLGRSLLATLAWAWFGFFIVLFIIGVTNSSSSRRRSSIDSDALVNFCFIGGFPLIFTLRGGKPKVDLYVRDKYVPKGKHTVVIPHAKPAAPPPPPPPVIQPAAQHIYIHQTPVPTAQSAPPPQQSGPAAMIPRLPARCDSCGQPLSMDSVRWSGPLSARCPSCGTAVEVKWDRIGG